MRWRVIAVTVALLALSAPETSAEGMRTADATLPAVRLGRSQTPEAMLRDLYPADLLTLPVVIGFADLRVGGMVPWYPQDHPECVGAVAQPGRCVLLDVGWTRLPVELQRSYLAHEWAHVLEQQHEYGLMNDECLAEEIAEQAMAAAGFKFIRHYVCDVDRGAEAAEVMFNDR